MQDEGGPIDEALGMMTSEMNRKLAKARSGYGPEARGVTGSLRETPRANFFDSI